MLRFLRRVAPAAALGRPSDPRPFSGLFLASASPSAAGHLGLARARPGLGDVLTPEALLLDATHALGAAVLRDQPRTGQANRVFHDLIAPAELARAEASGNAKAAEVQHVLMALLDVEDGRLQDGLHALARRAADYPAWGVSSVCAAAVCDMLGRADEGDRWLSGIPWVSHPREDMFYHAGIVTATLGGAPVASVAGSEVRVAAAVVHIVNDHVRDGKMSAVQIISAGMLKRAAMRDLELNREDEAGIFRALVKVVTGGSVPDPEDPHVNLLNASQALLSATVLRAPPLFGQRVRAALRAVQRDLARAVRKREDPAIVADLRLLVAFLAARDGRFDDALERYVELERADPSDPRPHYLAHLVCQFDGRREDSDKWLATYNRLATGSSVDDQASLVTLADELVVALALGGSLLAFNDENHPAAVRKVVGAAASRVDAALVCALQDKEGMSVVNRLEIRAVRAFLHAGVWSLLKELKSKDGGNGSTTD
ncbi:hypothetical protein HU200_050437 [Digitaria exilis]|uniref:Uncharacterized protein n=1 Tax=Digitaria exilis TaxID=1010633 RepID=A0A835AP24_9POAL|nr:hypothetical protein HU200_050437 [Digitaria exilis]